MEIMGFGSFTNSLLGSFTGGLNLTDTAGNQYLSGYSTSFSAPMSGLISDAPNGISFLISGAGDLFEIGNGGQGQPNFLLQNYEGNVGIENNHGVDELLIFGNPIVLGPYDAAADLVTDIIKITDTVVTISPRVTLVAFTYQLGSAYGPSWTSGSGVPSGAAVIGSIYSNTSGSVGSTLYVYNGSWVATA
jgi:hypothetical protein